MLYRTQENAETPRDFPRDRMALSEGKEGNLKHKVKKKRNKKDNKLRLKSIIYDSKVAVQH